MQVKNMGFVAPSGITNRLEGADHVLGAAEPTINPSGVWDWLNGEEQARRGVETFACTVFNTLRAIQTLIRFKTGIQVNYSDRYVASVAKFKGILDPSVGADPHKIAELIRTVSGCLREERLPWSSDIKSSADYYDVQNLAELMKEGPEWWKEWSFSHKWLWSGNPPPQQKQALCKDGLTKGTVCVATRAWIYDDVNKQYVKTVGDTDTHWTGLERYDGENPIVEDSYRESEGDYEKRLAPNYDFGFAKVYYLTGLADIKEQLTLLQRIVNAIRALINRLAETVQPPQSTFSLPIEIDLPPPVPPPKYFWLNRDLAKKSVRMICDDAGLSLADKNLICAVIEAESGFNVNAKNENKTNGVVTSTDYGICQINSFYWIGINKPFPSPQYVLENPEVCVRWMIKQFKNGKLSLWTAYKNGSYKQYL